MSTQTQVWIMFFATAIASGLLFSGLIWMVWKMVDFGRAWVLLWDEDGGHVALKRKRPRMGRITIKKGDSGETFYVDGGARRGLQTGKGVERSLYVVDRQTGWPLRGLTGMEREDYIQAVRSTGDDGEQRALRLRIQNPELSYKMTRTTIWQRWVQSKEAKPDWRVQLAPFALVAVIILAAVVGLLVWKQGV